MRPRAAMATAYLENISGIEISFKDFIHRYLQLLFSVMEIMTAPIDLTKPTVHFGVSRMNFNAKIKNVFSKFGGKIRNECGHFYCKHETCRMNFEFVFLQIPSWENKISSPLISNICFSLILQKSTSNTMLLFVTQMLKKKHKKQKNS